MGILRISMLYFYNKTDSKTQNQNNHLQTQNKETIIINTADRTENNGQINNGQTPTEVSEPGEKMAGETGQIIPEDDGQSNVKSGQIEKEGGQTPGSNGQSSEDGIGLISGLCLSQKIEELVARLRESPPQEPPEIFVSNLSQSLSLVRMCVLY